MAENYGRANLCGVGLKSIAANLGVASPVVDLPWLGPKKGSIFYKKNKCKGLNEKHMSC
jgi:hypothetical protein